MSAESDAESMAEKTAAVGTAAPSPSPEAVSQPPREKMIETAVKFLLNPQVRSSPIVQKKAFLQKKGVTDAEIEMAIDRSGTRQDVPATSNNQAPGAPPPQGQVPMAPYPGAPPQQQMVPYMQPPPPSRVTTWRDYAAVAVIISGVSFGIYKLVMKFITPWLKSRREERQRMERLEASIEELNKNVAQTVATLEKSVLAIQTLLEKQETQISAMNAEIVSGKAVTSSRRSTDATEIKAEIMSLKGLLLNRHQFPSTPQIKQIPAWQRGNDQSSTKSNSPPPPSAEVANGNTSSPPPLIREPITNGDASTDPAHTPVKMPVEENQVENAIQQEASPAPNEYANGSVEPVESQATPTIDGSA